MFKIYKAQNFGGGDGMLPLEPKYFSDKNLAIEFTKGKSDCGSDGQIWEIDVYEPESLTEPTSPATIQELPKINEKNWFLGY